MGRTCEHCRGPIEGHRRAQIRTCSTRCRVALHRKGRSRGVPRELRDRDRWVRWSETVRDGKKTKIPLRPDGSSASSTDPATWSRYAQVRAHSKKGLVLDGDGIVCVDLDDCLTADGLSPLARAVLDRCPPTYVEISPSGRGLHVWGRADVRRGRRVRKGSDRAEVYGTGRFITVTGNVHSTSAPILGDLSGVVRWLLT